ncbi:lysostaphin resistance A-like protein [candidate division CSSED10-310 bacterium]|uniref:Lysostaphin resistance A-like protein n=1 Tax=candidate division CSSED10-310 bacterium TaxID=2855610 RepID=A0ABV6Z0B2_UNCC1
MHAFPRNFDRRQLLILCFFFEGGLLLFALAMGAAFDRPILAGSHLIWAGLWWGVVSCVPLIGGLIFLLNSSAAHLVKLGQLIDQVVKHLFAHSRTFDIAVISILAGVGEEALFRGFMQTVLADSWGLIFAVFTTSIVFGLAHFLSLTYALYAGLMSIYLGLLLLVFDNIYVPMVTHAVYDFVALFYFRRRAVPLISDSQ